jgi:ABC-2 type transport system permease protein
MSPTTTATTLGPGLDGRYRLGHAIRSEWTKFTSLRSTRWTLVSFPLAALALGVLIGAVSGAGWDDLAPDARAIWDPTNNVLAGLIPGYLAIPVLGVLMMTSEHNHGVIRSTFAAIPDRRMVLAAKAVVLAAVAFVVCEVVTFVTWAAGQQVMGSAPHDTLGEPGVLRVLLLSPAYLALMALFGLGLGAIVRHSGAAIAIYSGVALVTPIVLNSLPGNLARFGPFVILANSVDAVKVQPEFLSPAVGFAVMALYTAVTLAVATVLLVRRDA